MTAQLTRYSGWAAYLSGALAAIVLVLPLLMLPLQQPAGPLIAILDPLIYFLMLPIALTLYRFGQNRAPGLGRLALTVGMAGAIARAVLALLFVITVEIQSLAGPLALCAIGVWLIVANVRSYGTLPRGLAWFGIVVGVVWVLAATGGLRPVGGTPSTMTSPMAQPNLLEIVVLLAALAGPVLYAIWAIWLGRVLLSDKFASR